MKTTAFFFQSFILRCDDPSVYDILSSDLECYRVRGLNCHVVLLGDFNVPSWQWLVYFSTSQSRGAQQKTLLWSTDDPKHLTSPHVHTIYLAAMPHTIGLTHNSFPPLYSKVPVLPSLSPSEHCVIKSAINHTPFKWWAWITQLFADVPAQLVVRLRSVFHNPGTDAS